MNSQSLLQQVQEQNNLILNAANIYNSVKVQAREKYTKLFKEFFLKNISTWHWVVSFRNDAYYPSRCWIEMDWKSSDIDHIIDITDSIRFEFKESINVLLCRDGGLIKITGDGLISNFNDLLQEYNIRNLSYKTQETQEKDYEEFKLAYNRYQAVQRIVEGRAVDTREIKE